MCNRDDGVLIAVPLITVCVFSLPNGGSVIQVMGVVGVGQNMKTMANP